MKSKNEKETIKEGVKFDNKFLRIKKKKKKKDIDKYFLNWRTLT